MPAPDPSTFEYDFTIAEEFEYIKPVLAAAIENNYEPSRARHEAFMRGGGARQKVLDMVPLRGSLNAKEKEELAYYVRCWARRRDRRREMGLSFEYPRDKLYAVENGRAGQDQPDGHVSWMTHRIPMSYNAWKLMRSFFQDSDGDSVLTPTSDLSMGDTEVRSIIHFAAICR